MPRWPGRRSRSMGGRGDGPPATNPNWDSQLFGAAGEYAFGEFSFDATLPDPQVGRGAFRAPRHHVHGGEAVAR